MVKCQVVPNTSAQSVQPVVLNNVPLHTTIISDEWMAYRGLGSFYIHEVVDHRSKEYVNACGFTTNSIEGFWSLLKRGIIASIYCLQT